MRYLIFLVPSNALNQNGVENAFEVSPKPASTFSVSFTDLKKMHSLFWSACFRRRSICHKNETKAIFSSVKEYNLDSRYILRDIIWVKMFSCWRRLLSRLDTIILVCIYSVSWLEVSLVKTFKSITVPRSNNFYTQVSHNFKEKVETTNCILKVSFLIWTRILQSEKALVSKWMGFLLLAFAFSLKQSSTSIKKSAAAWR